MSTKIGSFLFTLAIIAWEVIDIIHGRATALSWIALGFFSLVGLFELGAIFDEKKKTADASKIDDTTSTTTTAAPVSTKDTADEAANAMDEENDQDNSHQAA